MNVPEITVEITPDVKCTNPDGSVDTLIGVRIEAPSERSETGKKYAAFAIESLDEIDQSYVDAAAYSMAAYECPDSRGAEMRALESAYMLAIDGALMKALAQHAA